MELRTLLDALDDDGDLLRLAEPLDDAELPFAVAAEAARENEPAVLLDDVPGDGRLVCGLRGGPDQMARRERHPWSRVARGLGFAGDTCYASVLDTLTTPPERATPGREPLAAEATARDLTALPFPSVSTGDRPLVSEGLLAVEHEGEQLWTPVRGTVRGRRELRLQVPERAAAAAAGAPVTVALGVPTAATLAAQLTCSRTKPWRPWSPPDVAAAISGDPEPVAPAAGGVVPASAEVVVDGTATRADAPAETPAAAWESVSPSEPVTVAVEEVATRPDPLVPLVPLGEPLGDDTHLTSLAEAGRLQSRVNGYWGVSPVSWIGLPAEAALGICFVASEILYAGFEWQLANTLFSFGRSFDKIVVLDADATFEDLARALDDIWVKAHPSHDWVFSERAAPAATAPAYRTDGEPGARLYVDAAWDPRWDEEYIAPEVVFEEMYPAEIRRAVEDGWADLGFDGAER